MSRKVLPTNLAKFNKPQIRKWIDQFEVILTDCDGVLWLYTNVINSSNKVINRLLDMNKKIFFITNNSTKTREELAEKAKTMQFNIGIENMISTAYLAAQYLKLQNFNKKVYIVGSSGISQELEKVGIESFGVGPDVIEGNLATLVAQQFKPDPEVGAVVVGFDEHISFPKMMKAASYLNDPKIIFVATNTDERFPMPNFVVPGTGSIVRSIETCAERKATVVGKPESYLCEIFFKEEIKRDPSKFLMIGDRLNTDIWFGKNNNFQTLLVETGVHNIDKVQEIVDMVNRGEGDAELEKQIPDFYISSLGDLFNNYD